MDESTTTDAPVADGGSQSIQGVAIDDQGRALTEESQPEVTEPAEAADDQTETSQDAPQEEEPASADNSTTEWLKKKGVDPSSPEAIEKVAEMARNAEKAMHEKAQKASELEKTAKITEEQIPLDATPEQVERIGVRNLELRLDIRDWKSNNPDKLAHEAEMVKVLSDPVKKELVQGGYITLDDVYAMAVGGNPDTIANVKSQTKKETLQSLAQKQQAAVPVGNAVRSSVSGDTKITPQNVDQLVAKNDLAWFKANQEAINQAMAGI
jgi:hypothetical protein